MDMARHKAEDCWAMRHKVQDLIDVEVIAIDILNKHMIIVIITKSSGILLQTVCHIKPYI